jgi:hypothetical protein
MKRGREFKSRLDHHPVPRVSDIFGESLEIRPFACDLQLRMDPESASGGRLMSANRENTICPRFGQVHGSSLWLAFIDQAIH